MNFRRKIVWTTTGSLFILAVLFTVIILVDFNSQSASAQISFGTMTKKVFIKIKASPLQPPFEVSDDNEKTIKESINLAFEDAISKISEQVSGQYMLYSSTKGGVAIEPDWGIYVLFKQEGRGIGISITLTHKDKLVLNYLKVYSFTDNQEVTLKFSEMADFICDVIRKKIKDPNTTVISPDNSVITPISLTNFDSQDASFEFIGSSDSIYIKIKASPIQPPLKVSDDNKKTIKESINLAFEDAISEINKSDRGVFPQLLGEEPNWKLYVLFKQEGRGIGTSITLTHKDKPVLNYLKAYSFTDNQKITFKLSEMADFICDVIRKKIKDPNTTIISPDNSVIIP